MLAALKEIEAENEAKKAFLVTCLHCRSHIAALEVGHPWSCWRAKICCLDFMWERWSSEARSCYSQREGAEHIGLQSLPWHCLGIALALPWFEKFQGDENIFSKIIDGIIPCFKIFETEDSLILGFPFFFFYP